MVTSYNWAFIKNPYTGKWHAAENYNDLRNNINGPNVISSSNSETLVQLIDKYGSAEIIKKRIK